MNSGPTVVLFDIDGTLISAKGAGKQALERTLNKHFGARGAFDRVPFAGNTDPEILKGGLLALGIPARSDLIDELLSEYLTHLEAVVATADVLVHEGVVDLVEALTQNERFAVGLGTGNVAEGARIKLRRANLADRFEFGGFGCDSGCRATLIGEGVTRGLERLGTPRTETRVVVVGDTPRDVAAALAVEGECIGVTTGQHGADELTEAGATLVVGSLSDDRIPAFFGI